MTNTQPVQVRECMVILHLHTVLMWYALSQLPWQQEPRLVLPTGQQTTCELEHNETKVGLNCAPLVQV